MRARKRDTAEAPIVAALERVGCYVYRELPSDLLIHRAVWGPGWFRVQEVKTAKRKTRKTQMQQREFLADTGTAVVRTPEEALEDINKYLTCLKR